jgi:hypothetical protein
MSWNYADSRRQVVFQVGIDGTRVEMPVYGLVPGTPIDAEDAPDADAQAARQYAKLQALCAMTPAQILAWVQANVTTLATAQDAIATLAIAVGILGRRL